MDEKKNSFKTLAVKAVELQMRNNEPAVTAETFRRLTEAGYTEEQAKEKIADILAVHIVYATSFGREFNQDEYEKELNTLQ